MHKIFGYFIAREADAVVVKNKRAGFMAWFVDAFPSYEFKEDELIFYRFMEFCAQFGLPITEKYLSTFLITDLREIVLKENIRVKGTEQLGNVEDLVQVETMLAVTRDVVKGSFYSLLNEDTFNMDDFIAEASAFISERLDERTFELCGRAYEIRKTRKGTSKMVGAADSAELIHEEIAIIRDVYNKEKLVELASVAEDEEHTKSLEFLFDFGIPAIDNDCYGGHRGQMFGIQAAPGIGKTKFLIGPCLYRAAVVFHLNVNGFFLEEPGEAIKAMLIARHVYTLFKKEVKSDDIVFGHIPADLKDMVEAASVDLFKSGKYGKININGNCELYVETFIEKIKTQDKLHGPYDIVAIDYVGLVEQAPARNGQYKKQLDEHMIISQTLRKFKRFLLHSKKFGIAVSQLNKTGIEKSKKDMEIEATDAQGGTVVFRSSDYNITITANLDMEAKGLRRLSSPKKRIGMGLGNGILMRTRLGSCLWTQAESNVI